MYPIPVADFTTDNSRVSILNPVINFTNTSIKASEYNWILEDGFESNSIDISHEFPAKEANLHVFLIAQSEHGCIDTAIHTIQIYDELIFYVPNTFSPDGDNFNQTFTPIFTSGYDPLNFIMYIFDRWGEVVFETHDSSIGWQGLYGKGEKINCQDGLYIWKISYKEIKSDVTKTIVGNVILMR